MDDCGWTANTDDTMVTLATSYSVPDINLWMGTLIHKFDEKFG